jgi:hypothetical protein
MGLISRFSTMRMKKPCEGTLTVVSSNMPDPSATSQNYRIDGVISGPGIAPTAVVHHGVASVNKWPTSGATLPITFDLAKPDRLVVHWDRLDTGRDQAVAATQALAERMREAQAAPVAGAPSSSTRPEAGHAQAEYASSTATPDQLFTTTTNPAVFSALNELLESDVSTVVRLDPRSADTAALRQALLHAVGQDEVPPAAGPVSGGTG